MSENGNFAGVTHEMTDELMSKDLSPKEWRLVCFFIRYLQGYQMKERMIKTGFILEKTKLSKQRVIEGINSLLKKGLIERIPGWERGEYSYRWNDKFFNGRTHATKVVRIDPKITDLAAYKKKRSHKIRTPKSINPDSEVNKSGLRSPDNRTCDDRVAATSAGFGAPKDSIKEKKNILKREINSDEFYQESENKAPENARLIREMISRSFGSISR